MSYSKEVMDQSLIESEIERIEGETHEQYLDRLYASRYDRIVSGQLGREHYIATSKEERKRLEDLVDRDGLTGLLNQTGFADALVSQLEIIHQYHLPAYLAFLDVDRLKEFNDSRGHLAGNQLLQTYATTIQNISDRLSHLTFLIGRFGGDEFVLLMIGANEQTMRQLTQDIKANIPQAVKQRFNDPNLERTTSIGITKVQPTDNAQTLLERADQALLQAKQMRNHVVTK